MTGNKITTSQSTILNIVYFLHQYLHEHGFCSCINKLAIHTLRSLTDGAYKIHAFIIVVINTSSIGYSSAIH